MTDCFWPKAAAGLVIHSMTCNDPKQPVSMFEFSPIASQSNRPELSQGELLKPLIYLVLLGVSVSATAQDIASMDPEEVALKALTEGTGFLDPVEILAWVDLPHAVKKGEKITLKITVENARVDGDFDLESVDIDSSFLTGFRIESVTPKPAESDESFGSLTLEYSMTIAAGEVVDFYFEVAAVKEGVYVGEVSIWNEDTDFLSRYVQCKVLE